ncbi:hypothetical protein FRC12_009419 [Ceratobasidium sp. 428]|nr:hypothetical protein FRC12_009419 [Ceratobasidium sp. 428]
MTRLRVTTTSMLRLSTLTLVALFGVAHAQSGSGVTTRYWDCCKESCGWNGKASVSAPVQSCDINNNPLSDNNVQSGCNGGGAYACANHSPFVVNDSLSYGFAAVNIQGGSESSWCCQCYELTFTSGPVSGKKLVVQATNTGGDLGNNHFDLMIPGGGVGPQMMMVGSTVYLARVAPLNTEPHRPGGVLNMEVSQATCDTSAAECSQLPSALQAGCNWRFGWFGGADNPST